MSSLLASLLGGGRTQSTTYDSGGRTVAMEYVLPAAPKPSAAVLLLHGSDGAASSGKRFRLVMQGLAALGYAAVFPHYFDRTGDTTSGWGKGGRSPSADPSRNGRRP